jgi:hypothetical protein
MSNQAQAPSISVTVLDHLLNYNVSPGDISTSATLGRNTRNDKSYGHWDIPYPVTLWADFNMQTLRERFKVLLETKIPPTVDALLSPQPG